MEIISKIPLCRFWAPKYCRVPKRFFLYLTRGVLCSSFKKKQKKTVPVNNNLNIVKPLSFQNSEPGQKSGAFKQKVTEQNQKDQHAWSSLSGSRRALSSCDTFWTVFKNLRRKDTILV